MQLQKRKPKAAMSVRSYSLREREAVQVQPTKDWGSEDSSDGSDEGEGESESNDEDDSDEVRHEAV